MQLLVYEFVTGGGWYSCCHTPPDGSLLTEGLAMLRAAASDFAAIPQVTVHVLHDQRLPHFNLPDCRLHSIGNAEEERAKLLELAATCDWTLVIAPELSGFLAERCRWAAEAGRLLGPNLELVELASNKQRTAEHLSACGIRIPVGRPFSSNVPLPHDFPYPAVLKPRDGAGSQGVQMIASACERFLPFDGPARLEQYHPGIAASVGFLCGPHQQLPLQPCRQHLSSDGCFSYSGGSLLCELALAERAIRLASRAVASLPSPFGYLGLDLVLGNDALGSEDVVIEINPRLTTSYVGLRAACKDNLAAAMLAIANGSQVALSWDNEPLTFQADGRVLRPTAARPRS